MSGTLHAGDSVHVLMCHTVLGQHTAEQDADKWMVVTRYFLDLLQ
jgi:hypothetical protein